MEKAKIIQMHPRRPRKQSAKRNRIFFPHRTWALSGFVFFAFLLVVLRLFYLQILHGSELRAQGIFQRSSKIEIPARRGEILLKDNTTGDLVKLATNTTLDLVFIDPVITPDKQLVASTLAPLLFTEKDYENCQEDFDLCPENSVKTNEREVIKKNGEIEIKTENILPTFEEALNAYEIEILNKISREDVDFVILAKDYEEEVMDKIEKFYFPGITVNKKNNYISANPTQISAKDREKIAKTLSEYLNLSEENIYKKLAGGKREYIPLKRKIDPYVSEKIREIKRISREKNQQDKIRIFASKIDEEPIPDYFRGIGLVPEHLRYYPDKGLAAQIIGYVDHEGVGQYGIEGKWDSELAGKKGIIESQNDVFGTQIGIGTESVQDSENGTSIVLTIDRIIQKRTEEVLKEAVEKFKADSGQIIIMEPFTGKIIAMANYPTFNPNSFGEVYSLRQTTAEDAKKIFKTTPIFKKNENDKYVQVTFKEFEDAWKLKFNPEFYVYNNWLGLGAFVNKIIEETYEPGSVFKPLAMAAAIDSGEVTPTTKFNEDGPVKIGDYEIKTATNKYNGWQTMTNVIETSSNPGMVFVAFKLGRAVFYKYIKDFGFGDFTDIELENENHGDLDFYKQWSDAQLANSAFGQGLTATPLQMANAWCALANGGILMKPYIVSEKIKNEKVVEKNEPAKVRRVISPDTATMITAILVSSVNNGVARSAKIEGYSLAGKTGTSQIARSDGRGYEDTSKEGNVITSFAGYAPINKPRFVVLVKFDRPRVGDNTWGSTTAAPTFKTIVEFLFDYYGIPPDVK